MKKQRKKNKWVAFNPNEPEHLASFEKMIKKLVNTLKSAQTTEPSRFLNLETGEVINIPKNKGK